MEVAGGDRRGRSQGEGAGGERRGKSQVEVTGGGIRQIDQCAKSKPCPSQVQDNSKPSHGQVKAMISQCNAKATSRLCLGCVLAMSRLGQK